MVMTENGIVTTSAKHGISYIYCVGIWEVLHVMDHVECVMCTCHCEQMQMINISTEPFNLEYGFHALMVCYFTKDYL
jgi:dihydroorotase